MLGSALPEDWRGWPRSHGGQSRADLGGAMGGCFSHQRCSRHQRDTGPPESKEKESVAPPVADAETFPEALPAAPISAAAAAGEAWPCSMRSPGASTGPVTSAPESIPQAAPCLDALQKQLEALKELQSQYLQGQLQVRRTCQQFPRSLRTISLQICHARRRLIRIEVRLKRQEGEGSPSPAGPDPAPLPSLESLRGLSASALSHEPVSPKASDSQGLVSVGSSVSSASVPLHPFPPPLHSPPPLQPNLGDLKEMLAAIVELQAHHLQERKRDFRACQECLRSMRALRAQLRNVRNRLWVLEEKLGVQVPPRELDADEQQQEEEEEEELVLPPRPLDGGGEEREAMQMRGASDGPH